MIRFLHNAKFSSESMSRTSEVDRNDRNTSFSVCACAPLNANRGSSVRSEVASAEMEYSTPSHPSFQGGGQADRKRRQMEREK
ncbi:hypothetical protein TNCV_4419051 [Trichonephila clavipes]|nr:hypothetical protein TNCV_4419051 [Trichonephila clavipes]